VPLLHTYIVGADAGVKLLGPGHAAFVSGPDGTWYTVYHASKGPSDARRCRRYAFVDEMRWSADGWPYIVGNVPSSSSHRSERSRTYSLLPPGEVLPQAEADTPAEPLCRIVSTCDKAADVVNATTPITCNGISAFKVGAKLMTDEKAVQIAACTGGVA